MCSIAGFNWKNEELIQQMNCIQQHRGRDNSGIYTNENISLGHNRFSIIDLSSAGNQPMEYENLIIVFNGEIYNYQAIKDWLKTERICNFKTNTDTEIICAAYKHWGAKCVTKFNGMWAFCIYDKTKNILFCSRDRFGKKPFYYYFKEGQFAFASELKGILQHKDLNINRVENINKKALDLYFSLGYIPAPFTIFDNVYKLEQGYNLTFNLTNNDLSMDKYYELPNYNPNYNKKELIAEGKKLINDAVKLRMRADISVGAFLSGGLDSSTIVALMSQHTKLDKLHTFSMAFDDKEYDESLYITIVKEHLKTIHHHKYFTEKDFNDLLDNYSFWYDEPFGDFSGFPTYMVSKMAKENVGVCLSGDGGDEIFAGYKIHLMGARLDFIRKLPRFVRKILSKIPAKRNVDSLFNLYLLKEAFKLSLEPKENFFASSISTESFKPKIYQSWTIGKLGHCLETSKGNLAEALRIYDLLYNTTGDNFVTKVDRASSQQPLEVRSPFLDYRVVEWSMKIPTKWKINIFKTKILMREMIKNLLPTMIVQRGKQGFTPPIEEWIQKPEYQPILNEALETTKKCNIDFYNFIKDKMQNKSMLYNVYKLRMLFFHKWYQMWI